MKRLSRRVGEEAVRPDGGRYKIISGSHLHILAFVDTAENEGWELHGAIIPTFSGTSEMPWYYATLKWKDD